MNPEGGTPVQFHRHEFARAGLTPDRAAIDWVLGGFVVQIASKDTREFVAPAETRHTVCVRDIERSTLGEGGLAMVSIQWDSDDWPSDTTEQERVTRRRDRGKMPVASEARARAACKVTWRSKELSRRLGRKTDGMRNRRLRKLD
jgi:hypothetical protein